MESLIFAGAWKWPGNHRLIPMSHDDVIYEIFEPLSQGAPGNDASTLRALGEVPGRDSVRQVLDIGVGHGRTTFTLAQALPDAHITAVDIHPPFVEKLASNAREAGVADRVHPVLEDMATETAIQSHAEALGYRLVSSFRVPKQGHDAYYLPLEARVAELAGHGNADIVNVLESFQEEIEIARRDVDEAGYTFFVLQRDES